MIFLILSLVSVPDFSGVWQTTYGDMFLEQSGTEVTGWYSYGGMSSIEGTVDQQGRLVFTYDEGTATGEGTAAHEVTAPGSSWPTAETPSKVNGAPQETDGGVHGRATDQPVKHPPGL